MPRTFLKDNRYDDKHLTYLKFFLIFQEKNQLLLKQYTLSFYKINLLQQLILKNFQNFTLIQKNILILITQYDVRYADLVKELDTLTKIIENFIEKYYFQDEDSVNDLEATKQLTTFGNIYQIKNSLLAIYVNKYDEQLFPLFKTTMEQLESIQNLLNFKSKQQKENDQEDIRVFKYENHFFILKCLAEFYLKGKIIEKKPWKSNAYGTNYMTKAIEYMYDLDFKYGNVKSQL